MMEEIAMKRWKIFLILTLPLLCMSCFQKKAYTTPLYAGNFISEKPFSFNQKEYTGIKLITTEISKDDYTLSNSENTLKDYSLPVQERKYYSLEFYLLDHQKEIPIRMIFDKKCNPHETGPNVYHLKIDLPCENEFKTYGARLLVLSPTLEDTIYYHLSFNNMTESIEIDFFSFPLS